MTCRYFHSPKGDMIATGCTNGKIWFFDSESGEVERLGAWTGHSDTVDADSGRQHITPVHFPGYTPCFHITR